MDKDSKLVTDSGAAHGSASGVSISGRTVPHHQSECFLRHRQGHKSEATAPHLLPNLSPWSWGASTAVAVLLPRAQMHFLLSSVLGLAPPVRAHAPDAQLHEFP